MLFLSFNICYYQSLHLILVIVSYTQIKNFITNYLSCFLVTVKNNV